MKRNFFVKLKNNVYNIKTFSDYIKEGLGRAILYAIILSLILGGIQGIYTGVKTKNAIKSSIEELNNPNYEFSIKDGILHTKKNPIKVEDGNTVIYLDSNKKLNEADSFKDEYIQSDMYVLLLKDGIEVGSGSLSQTISYKDSAFNELNNEILKEQLQIVGKFILPVIVIVMIVQYFINYMLNCLIVSAFSMIIGMFMGLRMRGSAMYSLAIYAGTLPNLLLLPFSLIRPDIYFDVAFSVGTIIFSVFVLRNIKYELLKNKR